MKTKTLSRLVAVGLICGASFVVTNTRASSEVSVGVQINARADFEAPLAAEGAWVEVGSYGRCWHPRAVAVGWRPYCDGTWVWTDCGWYWESSEPWAWACYHYGRWADDPAYGWVWIPDVEWAPAWVYWRTGGGYIGWAPCAPVGVVIQPAFFAFVEVGHFHERIRPSTVVVNNTVIINQTTEITTIKRENRNIGGSNRRVVINEGPGVEPIQRATGRKVNAVPIQEAARQTPVPQSVTHRSTQPADQRQTPAVTEQKEQKPPTVREQPNRQEPPPGTVTQKPQSPPKSVSPAWQFGKEQPSDRSKRPHKQPVAPPATRPHPSGPPATAPANPPANGQGGERGQGPENSRGGSDAGKPDKDKP